MKWPKIDHKSYGYNLAPSFLALCTTIVLYAVSEQRTPTFLALIKACIALSIATPLLAKWNRRARSTIALPPGCTSRRLLDFFYSKKTMARVFEPILADMQAEWVEAIAQRRPYKAAWIRVRGYWEILRAAGFHSLLRAIQPFLKLFTGVA